MTKVRTFISILVIVLLGLGYAGSQLAALQGNAADYAVKIDSPPAQLLALVILLVSIIFAFIRVGEADDK